MLQPEFCGIIDAEQTTRYMFSSRQTLLHDLRRVLSVLEIETLPSGETLETLAAGSGPKSKRTVAAKLPLAVTESK
jgi:hypothetical protein